MFFFSQQRNNYFKFIVYRAKQFFWFFFFFNKLSRAETTQARCDISITYVVRRYTHTCDAMTDLSVS